MHPEIQNSMRKIIQNAIQNVKYNKMDTKFYKKYKNLQK